MSHTEKTPQIATGTLIQVFIDAILVERVDEKELVNYGKDAKEGWYFADRDDCHRYSDFERMIPLEQPNGEPLDVSMARRFAKAIRTKRMISMIESGFYKPDVGEMDKDEVIEKLKETYIDSLPYWELSSFSANSSDDVQELLNSKV